MKPTPHLWKLMTALVLFANTMHPGGGLNALDNAPQGSIYLFGRPKCALLHWNDSTEPFWSDRRPALSVYAREMQADYYASFAEPKDWPDWMFVDRGFRSRAGNGQIDPKLIAELRAATQAVADPRTAPADTDVSRRTLRELSRGMNTELKPYRYACGPTLVGILGRDTDNPKEVLEIRRRIESAQITFLVTAEGRRPKLALSILRFVLPDIDEKTAKMLLQASTDDLFVPAPQAWIDQGLEKYKTWRPKPWPAPQPSAHDRPR